MYFSATTNVLVSAAVVWILLMCRSQIVSSAALPESVAQKVANITAPAQPPLQESSESEKLTGSNNTNSTVDQPRALNASEFVGLSLDERVKKTEEEITFMDCVDYLDRFGYLEFDYEGLKTDMLVQLLKSALHRYQLAMGIPLTGVCDERTKKEMAALRCEVPDFITRRNRHKRFVLGSTKWESSEYPLTIAFSDHSPEMPKGEQEETMMAAAKAWSDNSGLQFSKGSRRNAKITIGFDNHDGPWGVLGRAWFPKVGKIIFERKEKWVTTIPGKSGDDLSFFSVAMHELGHALGISHSNNKNSIMQAQYNRAITELQADDIKAVQKLYGPKSKSSNSKKLTAPSKKSSKSNGETSSNKDASKGSGKKNDAKSNSPSTNKTNGKKTNNSSKNNTKPTQRASRKRTTFKATTKSNKNRTKPTRASRNDKNNKNNNRNNNNNNNKNNNKRRNNRNNTNRTTSRNSGVPSGSVLQG